MKRTTRVYLYFTTWVILSFITIILNVLNVDWEKTDLVNGIIIVIVLGILQGSVMEFPTQTIATLLIGGDKRRLATAKSDRLTIVLNYNLLAMSKDEIEECMETMFNAYMGNLSPNVSAVLVSATGDDDLKEYELEVRDRFRTSIFDTLFHEGTCFAKDEFGSIDLVRLENVWSLYEDVDKTLFFHEYLHDICDRYAREFMVVHRVSRVLRKCGQYQDLMLLSEGEDEAYSYCDPEFYGKAARKEGEPLFYDSDDVKNIFGRKFDYTLVLDGDTGVPKKCVFDLLDIAAANPEKGIIQPSIKIHCQPSDTIFMHIETIRQEIYEPMTNAIMELLGQSAYFGKAMLKNRIYIDNVIGSRDRLIERVPIDVLSHDTFEAAILRPLYAGSVCLLEAPSYNFVTWNIRERRWNRGEVLLAMYFWTGGIGRFMRWIKSKIQKDKFNATKLRTESALSFASSYVAYSALRQMIMKPTLLLYVVVHISVHLRYRYASIIIIMFLVLVFPKFATCNRRNFIYVILETIASIFQFTPEAMVGCVRIFKAVQANLAANVKWIPQRAVEDEFRNSNPFLSSFHHLWGYSLFALISGVLIVLFIPRAMLILIMLITLFLLPLYTGITSLPLKKHSSTSSDLSFPSTDREVALDNTDMTGTYKSVSGAFINEGFSRY